MFSFGSKFCRMLLKGAMISRLMPDVRAGKVSSSLHLLAQLLEVSLVHSSIIEFLSIRRFSILSFCAGYWQS